MAVVELSCISLEFLMVSSVHSPSKLF